MKAWETIYNIFLTVGIVIGSISLFRHIGDLIISITDIVNYTPSLSQESRLIFLLVIAFILVKLFEALIYSYSILKIEEKEE